MPYANGPIHIGHLVEYIQTDIFVRFLKLIGKDVIYCCADDTHGTPIEIRAKQQGIKPEELIAKFFKEHTEDFKSFLIHFDSYYTTNSKENKEFADLIFKRLKKNGFIYKKEIEITYCEHCKRSLPDRYVKGTCPKCGAENQYGDVCEKCNTSYKTVDLVDPYCVVCKNKPIRKKSEHYFFKLSEFSGKLKKWITENKLIQKEIKNFVFNWIKEGLEDWCISRDGPYFGFKIPGEKNKYYYVWLDAPIGYISSAANYFGKNVKKTEKEWNKADIIHFIGKDIIYFHFLFWPAMLLGAEFALPKYLLVHGFLTVNGEKMSKSRGTFFTAKDFLKKYDAECLRYYYAKVLSRRLSDVDLDFNDFNTSINNELVANLANFCYRVISFLNKNFDNGVGKIEKDSKLVKEVNEKVKKIKKDYEDCNFNSAVKEILAISDLGNRYFQSKEPWKLIKKDKVKAHKEVGFAANIVKVLSILISPILPAFSAELQKQLNLKDLTWEDIKFDFENKDINKGKILIKKMEVEAVKEVLPLDLKVGKILEVKDHPNADKLTVMQIDLGTEKRQIVAGIKEHYSIEDLQGKNLIIVTNLKHAKLRGVESQGMLLAGCSDDEKEIGLLTVKANPGDNVYFEGIEHSSEQISFDNFLKIKMLVKGGKCYYKDKVLKTDKEEVIVEKVGDGCRVR